MLCDLIWQVMPRSSEMTCLGEPREMSTISPNRLRKIKEQLNNGKSHYGQ